MWFECGPVIKQKFKPQMFTYFLWFFVICRSSWGHWRPKRKMHNIDCSGFHAIHKEPLITLFTLKCWVMLLTSKFIRSSKHFYVWVYWKNGNSTQWKQSKEQPSIPPSIRYVNAEITRIYMYYALNRFRASTEPWLKLSTKYKHCEN